MLDLVTLTLTCLIWCSLSSEASTHSSRTRSRLGWKVSLRRKRFWLSTLLLSTIFSDLIVFFHLQREGGRWVEAGLGVGGGGVRAHACVCVCVCGGEDRGGEGRTGGMTRAVRRCGAGRRCGAAVRCGGAVRCGAVRCGAVRRTCSGPSSSGSG
jgi:hypothetical protein